MEEDLRRAVGDYRQRLADLRQEVARLEGLVADLEAAPASRSTARDLRRARKQLERARGRLDAEARDYALFRLREAIGPDPEWIPREVFDWTLMEMSSGPLTRRLGREARAGQIAFETLRELLLADLPVGQLVENERAEHRSTILFQAEEGKAGTKTVLRRWAAMTQSDDYVADILARAQEARRRFSELVQRWSEALETARINYELKNRGSDQLTFETRDGHLALVAANEWANIARLCPEEASDLVACFEEMAEVRSTLAALRDELNAELRAFMREFVPRYLTYASRQTKERRRALGLERAPLRRLCRYLLEQVEDTDFLLPGGGGLEVGVPRMPEGSRAFRTSATHHPRQSPQEPEPDL